MYCYICSAFGHTLSDCPNKKAIAIRQGKPSKHISNLTLHVPKDNIQKFLVDNGVVEKASTYIPEQKIRSLLRDYANSLKPPKMIVFV